MSAPRSGTSAPQRQLRLAGVAIILILTAGLGVNIQSTRPSYVESATVFFRLPAFEASANAYSWLAPSLISAGQAMSQIVMNSQSQNLVYAAGGIGHHDLELINSYNQDYPDYNYPYATLTATSPDAAETHWTFVLATRMINQVLTRQQAQVPPGSQIVAQIIGDTGPLVQAASHKRAFAGLAILALVAGTWAWGFLGRWNPEGNPTARYAG